MNRRDELCGDADDVRDTGETFARAKAAVEKAAAGLAEYRAPENHPVGNCPLCQAGQAATKF